MVVDSSVWIANFRDLDTDAVRKLRSATTLILVGDVVLLELLQGARSDRHAEQLHDRLRRFQVVPMLGHGLAVHASRNYRILRARGKTIRKAVDLIIGTFCIAHGHTLLHQDRDFAPMVEHLGLQLA